MAQGTTAIRIDHHPAIHEIPTDPPDEVRPLTLMALVDAVGEVSETEQEVIATVSYMLQSGRIQLAPQLDADLCAAHG